eukprot:UN31724
MNDKMNGYLTTGFLLDTSKVVVVLESVLQCTMIETIRYNSDALTNFLTKLFRVSPDVEFWNAITTEDHKILQVYQLKTRKSIQIGLICSIKYCQKENSSKGTRFCRTRMGILQK